MSRRKIYAYLIIVALIALMGFGIYYLVSSRDVPKATYKEDETQEEVNNNEIVNLDGYLKVKYNSKEYSYNQSVISILFLGIDGAEGDPLMGQSDFMSLLCINRDDEKISIIQIPRDTITLINEYDSEGNEVNRFDGQITVAYPLGGDSPSACSRNALRATSNMLNGIILDNYITIPLSILPDLVDVFGQTDIVLPDDSLSHVDEKYVEGYSFHIDKSTIETYLRSRNTKQDFTAVNRMNRQQLYLKYCLSKLDSLMENTSSITTLLNLLDKCSTNITRGKIENYLDYYKKFEANGVETVTIPGKSATSSKYDEYHIDRDGLNQMIIDLFYKED